MCDNKLKSSYLIPPLPCFSLCVLFWEHNAVFLFHAPLLLICQLMVPHSYALWALWALWALCVCVRVSFLWLSDWIWLVWLPSHRSLGWQHGGSGEGEVVTVGVVLKWPPTLLHRHSVTVVLTCTWCDADHDGKWEREVRARNICVSLSLWSLDECIQKYVTHIEC